MDAWWLSRVLGDLWLWWSAWEAARIVRAPPFRTKRWAGAISIWRKRPQEHVVQYSCSKHRESFFYAALALEMPVSTVLAGHSGESADRPTDDIERHVE
jgi:hypothetical protein